eukprot:c92_g1_i1 orf=104-367(+)
MQCDQGKTTKICVKPHKEEKGTFLPIVSQQDLNPQLLNLHIQVLTHPRRRINTIISTFQPRGPSTMYMGNAYVWLSPDDSRLIFEGE